MSRSDWQDAFGDMGLRQEAQLTRLPLTILDPWVDEDGNPQGFRPYTKEELQDTAESIMENGIIEPIRARPRNGRFQILAGHNRVIAAGMAGLTMVPAIVEDVDDYRAVKMLTDSNIKHRGELLPSELAWAYQEQMKEEKKLRKAGRPSKENPCKICTDLEEAESVDNSCKICTDSRSDEAIAGKKKISARTVQNYIRLNNLIPPLLSKVDAKKIGIMVGVDLSYLSQEAQTTLVRIMEQHGVKKIRGSQSAELKAAGPNPSEETILQVLGIFGEEKDSFPSLTIKPDFSDYSPSIVKRLKKDNAYIEGLQIAIQQFTDRYIQDFEKEATT